MGEGIIIWSPGRDIILFYISVEGLYNNKLI